MFAGADTTDVSDVAEWFVKPLTILAIVVGAVILSRLSRWIIKRALRRLAAEPSDRMQRLRDKTPNALLASTQWSLRAEARTQTLTAVFRSMASILIWFIALLWILEVIGIDLGPFIAVSSIVGVALGFGAQNVVRDVLSGFFAVIEDQFGVGDTVDLGPDAKGTVEKVNLRSTRVRDVNGTVWHVPNGQILRVGNKSQEWARALLDFEVGIDTDYEVARSLIQGAADGLAQDTTWAFEVLEPPAVWGIESFSPGSYLVRLVVKTRPASQFGVMRELRIRIKAAFDDAGVVLPGGGKSEVWVHDADRQDSGRDTETATDTDS